MFLTVLIPLLKERDFFIKITHAIIHGLSNYLKISITNIFYTH
jgi:hypothetical protein